MKKNILNLALAAFVAVGTVAYTGCGKKGCTVEADDKFDADATESDPEACDPAATVAKFAGTYSVTETCTSGNDAYTITIAASGSSEYTILITNMYDAGSTFIVNATVDQNEITIANQTVVGVAVSGSGSINGNTLTVSYTVSVGGQSDTCSITAQKQ